MVNTHEVFNRIQYISNEFSPSVHQEEANVIAYSAFQECSLLHNYEKESFLRHSHTLDIVSHTMSARRCTVGFHVVL